jgi:hypothetical protein
MCVHVYDYVPVCIVINMIWCIYTSLCLWHNKPWPTLTTNSTAGSWPQMPTYMPLHYTASTALNLGGSTDMAQLTNQYRGQFFLPPLGYGGQQNFWPLQGGMCVYICILLHIYIHIYIYMCIPICKNMYTPPWICTYMVHLYNCGCMYVIIYLYVYV